MVKKKIPTEPLALEDPPEVKEESTEEQATEKPVEEAKLQKPRTTKTITCPNCDKSMLEKTFKYYHSLKCHPQAQPKESQEPTEGEAAHIVDFGFGKRIQARKEKYSNLFSRAV